jgi:branched-chain amino acid transport system ATP-binding protein
MNTKSILEIQGLTRQFGGLVAVDKLSLEIYEGELFGVIGPNGSGKTTLFNMLTGFLAPSSGSITSDGQRVDGVRPELLVRRGIARTFQAVRFHKESTVRETIWAAQAVHLSLKQLWYPMGAACEAEWQNEVDQILKKTWLEPHADMLASELPFGLVRQLEIARALATRPKILLMDEPASGMNPSETVQLTQDIKRLNEGGLTIVLVEHDVEMVMELCNRIAVLNFGKLIAFGTPQEIRANPKVIEAYLGTKAAAHA